MPSIETAYRKPFPQELTQKPEQIRTALDFDIAVGNLIRYAVEDFETRETGLPFFRTRKIKCPLGTYNFEQGPSMATIPLGSIERAQIPKPLWDFMAGGYFDESTPLNVTAISKPGPGLASILAIAKPDSSPKSKRIEVASRNPNSIVFLKEDSIRTSYDHQTILTLAQQMIDLAFDAAGRVKISNIGKYN